MVLKKLREININSAFDANVAYSSSFFKPYESKTEPWKHAISPVVLMALGSALLIKNIRQDDDKALRPAKSISISLVLSLQNALIIAASPVAVPLTLTTRTVKTVSQGKEKSEVVAMEDLHHKEQNPEDCQTPAFPL